jgi:hypothetical protein
MNVPEELLAQVVKAETIVDPYEKDLISFLMDHRGLAVQYALIVAVPVAFFAFEIGRHFHT